MKQVRIVLSPKEILIILISKEILILSPVFNEWFMAAELYGDFIDNGLSITSNDSEYLLKIDNTHILGIGNPPMIITIINYLSENTMNNIDVELFSRCKKLLKIY